MVSETITECKSESHFFNRKGGQSEHHWKGVLFSDDCRFRLGNDNKTLRVSSKKQGFPCHLWIQKLWHKRKTKRKAKNLVSNYSHDLEMELEIEIIYITNIWRITWQLVLTKVTKTELGAIQSIPSSPGHSFPNTFIEFRIYQSMPRSACKGERSFSKTGQNKISEKEYHGPRSSKFLITDVSWAGIREEYCFYQYYQTICK